MKTNPNDPSAPAPHQSQDGTIQHDVYLGLTKREYFAGLAMQSFITSTIIRKKTLFSKMKILIGINGWKADHEFNKDAISRASLEVADALINELNR